MSGGVGRARGRARGLSLTDIQKADRERLDTLNVAAMAEMNLSQKNDLSKLDDARSVISESQGQIGLVLRATHTRPLHIENKTGTSGREIKCVTNFIAINAYPEWTTFQYHVNFTPNVDSKSYRIKMMREHAHIFGQDPIFDGMILYMPTKIDVVNLERYSKHPKTNETIKITVRLTNELPASNPQCLTIFNLCNRKSFEYLGYKQLGRHFFDPNAMADVEKHRIEIWPGIISAIRLHEEKLLLACEMSHKLLRTDNVAAFLKELYQRFGPQSFHDKAVQILVGSSVLTRYNNKTYRVDDILWDKHPTEKFTLSDGTETTYLDYYAKQYNKIIRETDQPVLLSRAKNRGPAGASVQDIFLIPELCSMTGLTDEMRADRRVMQDLAQYTRVSPSARVEHGRKYLRNIRQNRNANGIFERWGLQLDDDLLEVTARVLPTEPLYFGTRSVNYDGQTADWSRECRSMPLNDAVLMDNWLLVFNDRDYKPAEEFYKNIKSLAPSMGMKITEPIICRLNGDRPSDFLDGITDALNKHPVQMVVAMVPNENKTRYDAIKKTCCLDKPVPSQVFRSSSIVKNTVSVCTKILLQMNCKLGGSIWRVDVPMKRVMVIGYDAYHDSTNKGKSVGAAVFSLDPTLTKWYSQCALHGESKQLVSNLTGFCKNGLKKYLEHTGFLPDKIFFYRDGVGDGQIPVVFDDELPQVQKAFKEIGSNYDPKLAFIIVTKRVNTRYFEKVGNEFKNPPPGTVLDNGVTKPERYDFYLVPQCVRQGTVTPVSYNIIFDDSGLKPDHMQRLAYKMCHLYYNWQGTIRLPAPCQYAHKLAFLVGQSLHKPAGEVLADKLFFL